MGKNGCIRIIILFAVLLICSRAFGETKIQNTSSSDVSSIFEPRLIFVDSIPWASFSDIAIVGDYAYCGMNYGLMILDVTNLSTPVEVSRLNLPIKQIRDIAVGNGIVSIADDDSLYIIDVSDVEEPVKASTIDLGRPFLPLSVTIIDTLIFIIESGDGIYAYSIYNPEAPDYLGYLALGGAPLSLIIEWPYAYIANYDIGLQIVRISPPNGLELVGVCGDVQYATQVGISGDYAYLASANSGLFVIDITEKTNPTLEINFEPPARLDNIVVGGQYVYGTSLSDGLQIINISDPIHPFVEGVETTALGIPYLSGNNLFVANKEISFNVYDVSAADAPTKIGYYRRYRESVSDMAISDNYLYAVGKDLKVYNTNGGKADYISGISGGYGSAIEIDNDRAFIVSSDSMLKVVDITDPSNLEIVASIGIDIEATDIALYGDYAYIGGYRSGIVIVDISTPGSPSVATVYGDDWTNKLIIADGYLYHGDLSIYNLSNPLVPELESHNYCHVGWITGMIVAENHLFITYAEGELMIGALVVLDITDKENPITDTVYETNMEAHAVAVNGNYAYVSSYSLESINISNLDSIYLVQTIEGIYSNKILIHENKAYVADWRHLYIYETDIICPDANEDGKVNLGDAIFILNYIFKNWPSPRTGDANCDGNINIGDVIYLINFIFKFGPAPCQGC